MQSTSALYKSIIAGEHWFETLVTIKDKNGAVRALNGDTIDEVTSATPNAEYAIFSLDRSRPGMSQSYPSIGGALSSTLRITILNPSYNIPKMGEIKVYYRATNGTQTSEWIAAGTYYIDTRARNQSYSGIDTLDITAFDAMMQAEKPYPDTEHTWPYRDRLVAAEIASTIGVTVDSRTNNFLTANRMIEAPTGYVMREVLEHIAGMYGGNFIITADNKLLFVPLYGLDPEEDLTGRYLTQEGSTNALTFGTEGWYILV